MSATDLMTSVGFESGSMSSGIHETLKCYNLALYLLHTFDTFCLEVIMTCEHSAGGLLSAFLGSVNGIFYTMI